MGKRKEKKKKREREDGLSNREGERNSYHSMCLMPYPNTSLNRVRVRIRLTLRPTKCIKIRNTTKCTKITKTLTNILKYLDTSQLNLIYLEPLNINFISLSTHPLKLEHGYLTCPACYMIETLNKKRRNIKKQQ